MKCCLGVVLSGWVVIVVYVCVLELLFSSLFVLRMFGRFEVCVSNWCMCMFFYVGGRLFR